ncbi:Na/Pi cotransporter family protein [Methanospirillum stamsii]|uniref:Sodium:phosphate symporter n=1 Tax=Methanospirillum stamsii TaxID=1277351 RepID=A0A2V2NJM4_9EURY|nr:Na/Pi cotransporter family protein [Methanospirillum stamsii]PWR75811.1 sodium:phosphate symporter [Methanospirillum stamsii]
MVSWEFVFAIIPGIILFLYGIEQFSREIQIASGEFLRSFIQRLTKTPLRGTAAGTLVTAFVQSSTATTVITIGLVNAGIISFSASLGVIFGANLGTTLTSQLVAFNLTAFAPIFILLGFVMGIIPGKYRIFGRPVFYFGLVFFSLSLISSVMVPYRTDPQLIAFLALMDTVFLQIAFGFIITNIFQSSSVTTGLVVLMSQSGLITPYMAIPIILGANIGTSTTALLVAARMNTSAKRAAVAHFIFNFGGALIFLPILPLLTDFILSLGGDAGQQVANAHLIFNLTSCFIFLILINPFERIVTWMVPGRKDDVVFVVHNLEHPPNKNNPTVIMQIEEEIINIFSISQSLLTELTDIITDRKNYSTHIRQLRDYAVFLDQQISETALQISERNLSPDESKRLARLVRISKLAEVLAEQTGELVEIIYQIQERGILISETSKAALQDLLLPSGKNMKTLSEIFPTISDEKNQEMRKQDESLREMVMLQYQEYLDRFTSHSTPSGTEFSRALFQVEGMAATIREIRKSARMLGKK